MTATGVPEKEIYQILSNARRRKTLEYLGEAEGTIDVPELSERIAEAESGESPPPKNVRKAVYVSLHQTHLPMLDDKGLIEYDRTEKEVRLLDAGRDVRLYMETTAGRGMTWAGIYLALSVVALLVVVAAIVDAPVVGRVEPILWASTFLGVFGAATAYQLWNGRRISLGQLFR